MIFRPLTVVLGVVVVVVVVVVARLTLQKKPVKPVKSQIRPQLTEEKQRFIHLKIRKRVFLYRIFITFYRI